MDLKQYFEPIKGTEWESYKLLVERSVQSEAFLENLSFCVNLQGGKKMEELDLFGGCMW